MEKPGDQGTYRAVRICCWHITSPFLYLLFAANMCCRQLSWNLENVLLFYLKLFDTSDLCCKMAYWWCPPRRSAASSLTGPSAIRSLPTHSRSNVPSTMMNSYMHTLKSEQVNGESKIKTSVWYPTCFVPESAVLSIKSVSSSLDSKPRHDMYVHPLIWNIYFDGDSGGETQKITCGAKTKVT